MKEQIVGFEDGIEWEISTYCSERYKKYTILYFSLYKPINIWYRNKLKKCSKIIIISKENSIMMNNEKIPNKSVLNNER